MHLVFCSDEPLTVQAPGSQTRSFCFVSDMVRNCPLRFGDYRFFDVSFRAKDNCFVNIVNCMSG